MAENTGADGIPVGGFGLGMSLKAVRGVPGFIFI
jgi:hypothetical protein